MMRHPFDAAYAHAFAFRATLPERAPRPAMDACALTARFDGPLPEQGMDSAAVIDALAQAAEPGLMAIPGGRFFGWVIGASHEAGVAADWLTSAWGQNAGNPLCTPAACAAEKIAGDWLLELLDLPAESSVGFVTGATMANFTCLAAARNEVLARVGWDAEAHGLVGAPRVRIFTGADAHATVFSALRYLGFGAESARRIGTDAQGRMNARALAAALAESAGPAIVIAQAGQINTGAVDPLTEIAAICRAHGAWLHIDGAFGLWARAAPELAPMCAGAELADSWATDGHKWLQAPYDTGFAIVRDAAAHRRAMGISASYLPASREHDPSQYAPELSRRARGFAVWAIIKAMGREGVAEMVRRHCGFAQRIAQRLSAEPGVEIINEVSLNQVIVSFGDDAATRGVIARMQANNVCFVGGADWRGRWVMRLSIISGPLDGRDIDRLIDAILRAWREGDDGGAAQSGCPVFIGDY